MNISLSDPQSHIDRVIDDPAYHVADLELSNHDCHDSRSLAPQSFDSTTLLSPHIVSDRIQTWPSPSAQALQQSALFRTYIKVRDSGMPNMYAARIPVPSSLCHDVWKQWASGHSDDRFVLDGIRYGFPMQYIGPKLVVSNPSRHVSDLDDSSHIAEYIQSELANRALLGPFDHPPFCEWFFTAPLMTRPKSEPGKRRIIVDLSYPRENNVNMFIRKNVLFGAQHTHDLPMVDDLVEAARAFDFNCFIGVIDIQRAYRNVPTCPMDLPLLGIKYADKYYVDSAMPFGARISSLNMQKLAHFIVRALASMSVPAFMFLDDLAVVLDPQSNPQQKFFDIMSFLRSLGLPIAYSKLQMPATVVKYLGIVIDLPIRQLRIPDTKISEFLDIVNFLAKQHTVPLKALQSFVGRVNYLGKAVPPARLFISRTLQLIRDNFSAQQVTIDKHMRADLKWFRRFLRSYNGRSIIKPSQPDKTILADSCLSAGGATDFHKFYEFVYPERVANQYHITVLEALNCLIALRILLDDSDNHTTVKLCCDSLSTVYTLTTGRARDPVLAAIARAVWMIQAKRDICLLVVHVPGKDMSIPDALSRAHLSQAARTSADVIIDNLAITRVFPPVYITDFSAYL